MHAWRSAALLSLALTVLACGGADGGAEGDTTDPGNGSLVGKVLPNLTFRDPVAGTDVTTDSFKASGHTKALLLNASAGWCTVCKAEAPELAAWHEQYADQGLAILYTVFEDADGAPASDAFAKGWCGALELPFTCLVDAAFASGGGLSGYFDPSSAPLNLLVRASDMTIVYAATGFDADSAALLEQKIANLLGL
jgi:thiol-disulfide isomerase/thioredoxin